MFVISMPLSFKIGDTATCRINHEPAQVSWHGADTLVIGFIDPRHIVKTHVENGLRWFICGDGDDSRYGESPYCVEDIPGEGFIVFSNPEKTR